MKKYLILVIILLALVAWPASATTTSAQLQIWLTELSVYFQTHPPAPIGLPPVLHKVNQDKDARVKLGQPAIWQFFAIDPEGGPLNYQVTWGDESQVLKSNVTISNFSMTVGEMTVLKHFYPRPGLYQPFFTITDNGGNQIRIQSSVTVLP